MKAVLKVIFFGFAWVTFSLLVIYVSSIRFKYPEPFNVAGYGFYEGHSYERISDRNPFTSKNGSNMDTLTVTEKSGYWIKFHTGEIYKLHSDSMNVYYWKSIK